jgi:NAD(P)-dependent dehydrogenase (short-subunit alcohol dehydrogenase family)
MQDKLADRKICTLVGAGPGLGLALAKRFGREGFIIVFVSRRREARKGYITLLADEGMQAYAVAADPADGLSLKGAFDHIKKQLGFPEVLIYNATVRAPRASPSALEINQLIEDFTINVAGALLCAQQVIPDMRTQGKGTIFFTAGGYGSHTEIPFTSLAIGRASVRILCNSLGVELQPYGIHVATVVVRGVMQKGGRFDPDLIAEEYWKLYNREPGYQGREIIFDEIFDQDVGSIRER